MPTDGIMEIVKYKAYDLKFISDADINYNPALGTGQIQIKDIRYLEYQTPATREFGQLLDEKWVRLKWDVPLKIFCYYRNQHVI